MPLGVEVRLRAMSWNAYPYDDAVVLEYRIANVSGADLTDVSVGFWEDTTVGNTAYRSPYVSPQPGVLLWNWYDDMNGAWHPGDFADDPDLWMMWEHDDDGDDGTATGWIGCRLLGCDPAPEPAPGMPPVSYNAEGYSRWPATDDAVPDTVNGGFLPGRYQLLANGDFDVGATPERDFTIAFDWEGLLSVGPIPVLAADDTLKVTFALVGGEDAWSLWRNGKHLRDLAAAGYVVDLADAGPVAPATRLGAACPNPFNARTSIGYALGESGRVRLSVHDLAGRRIATLVDGRREAGAHQAPWDGRDDAGRAVSSGVYLYRLEAGGVRESGRMILVK